MKKKRRGVRALVAGCYDPVTRGHESLIAYASRKYAKVYVTVFINAKKKSFFSLTQRMKMLKAVCAKYPNVRVEFDGGYLWKYAKRRGIAVTVRGYRNEEDLKYEENMARYNKNALPTLETELIRSEESLSCVSSTRVRALLKEGKDVSSFVPEEILPFLDCGDDPETEKTPENEAGKTVEKES